MNITPDTKIKEILGTYPMLRELLPKIDKRFAVINTPPGRLMLRNATVRDVAKKGNVTPEKILSELRKILSDKNII